MCHVSITTAGFPRSETGGFSPVLLQNKRTEVIANRSGTRFAVASTILRRPMP